MGRQWSSEKPSLRVRFLVCAASALLLSQCVHSAISNVAVDWNTFLTSLICKHGIFFNDANTYYSQLHLAQWHALLALKNTGSCTTQEAVVAYASHAVLVNYLTFEQDTSIDPMLETQLQGLSPGLTKGQRKLAKALGEAVAVRLVSGRVGDPGREFSREAATEALDARPKNVSGLYRAPEPTAPLLSTKLFSHLGLTKTFVLPNPLFFREAFLAKYKPPAVPSKAWDTEYRQLKSIGSVNWVGRTTEVNNTASFWFGFPFKGSLCSATTFWSSAAIALLPAQTPLYDTVTILAKLHVAIHDANVMAAAMQWGFWYWRPVTAFREGDPDHAPDPSWAPWSEYNLHPEYPSLTATTAGAGAEALRTLLKSDGAFTVEGGYTGFPACTPGPEIGRRHYASLEAAVEEAKLGRMYAGHHYNISVTHGAEIGALVAKFVTAHWSLPPPSGVAPDPTYLTVFARLPARVPDFSPITLNLE
ncbi:hypothetical protein M758_12G122400 [Ceratodon purpureus]|nr:hypothetical protein M758_12G122400 [Ceratodon purpureus]